MGYWRTGPRRARLTRGDRPDAARRHGARRDRAPDRRRRRRVPPAGDARRSPSDSSPLVAIASLAIGTRQIAARPRRCSSFTAPVAGRSPTSSSCATCGCRARSSASWPGAALGVVGGAACRASTRNPLADPGLLGINAGASLAVVARDLVPRRRLAVRLHLVRLRAAPRSPRRSCSRSAPAGASGATPAKLALTGAARHGGDDAPHHAPADPRRRHAHAVPVLVGRLPVGPRSRDAPRCCGRSSSVGLVLAAWLAGRLNLLALGDDVARGLGARLGDHADRDGRRRHRARGHRDRRSPGPIALLGLAVAARRARARRRRLPVDHAARRACSAPIVLLAADVIGRRGRRRPPSSRRASSPRSSGRPCSSPSCAGRRGRRCDRRDGRDARGPERARGRPRRGGSPRGRSRRGTVARVRRGARLAPGARGRDRVAPARRRRPRRSATSLAALVGQGSPKAEFVIMRLRLPRVAAAVIAGTALGLGGRSFQTTLRNPLASPDILGVTGGASLAAVGSMLLLGLERPRRCRSRRSRARSCVAALMWGARVARRASRASGSCSSASGSRRSSRACSAGSSRGRRCARHPRRWSGWSGGIASIGWPELATAGGALVVLLVLTVVFSSADAAARALRRQRPLPRTRRRRAPASWRSCSASRLVAVATALAGPIAFVALVAAPDRPRARGTRRGRARGIRRSSAPPSCSSPTSWRSTRFAGVAVPVGIVTGLIGAPYLLWLIARGTGEDPTDDPSAPHTLRAESLTLGYDGRSVIEGLDLEMPDGTITADRRPRTRAASPRCCAASRASCAPEAGRVTLDGARHPLVRRRKEFARRVALLPQQPVAPDGVLGRRARRPRPASAPAAGSAGARATTTASSPRRSRRPASPSSPTGRVASSRAASASGSGSPWRSRSEPTSCCSTSPRASST